jgi:hypothetical protein
MSSDVTEVRHVTAARRRYACDWCCRNIRIGEPYATWFRYGDRHAFRMHPECYRRHEQESELLPPEGRR